MYKLTMTTIGALALLGAGAASAHPATSGSSAGSAKTGWHASHQDRMTARLAKLKSQLKITAAQESAWSGFTMAIQGMRPAKPPQMMSKQSGGLTPAPDVFNGMAKMAEERARHAQKLAQAASKLYQALTSTQRAILDKHLADMHAKMHRMHSHHAKKMHAPMAPRPQAGSGGNG